MDGYRQLCMAILRQAWNDANNKYSKRKNWRSTKETKLARLFLMGRYSRDMMEWVCMVIDTDPNFIIRLAKTQSWAKDYIPLYFRGIRDDYGDKIYRRRTINRREY